MEIVCFAVMALFKMKYIVLIIGLLVVGCGKQEKTDANESTPTTNTNVVDGTTEKPVKELTLEEKVVGAYERKNSRVIFKYVFLENGTLEQYGNGNKEHESKWTISKEGEIHHIENEGFIMVYRINEDESITNIALILDGKRADFPIEEQDTFKKIK